MKIITQAKPNRLLLDNELPPTPKVAIKELGHTAAGILQQIYFLSTVKGLKHRRDSENRDWYFFPIHKWADAMVRSLSTVKRAIAKLVRAGFIYVERWSKHEWYQCNYYSINYEAIANDFVLGEYFAATGSQEPRQKVIQRIVQHVIRKKKAIPQQNVAQHAEQDVPDDEAIQDVIQDVVQEVEIEGYPEVIQDIIQEIEDEDEEIWEKPQPKRVKASRGKKAGFGNQESGEKSESKPNSQISEIIKRASKKALIPTPELDAEIEVEKAFEVPKSLKMALAIATGLPEIKEVDEVVLPHQEELEKMGIDTQKPELVKAVKEASDSYLSIQAWLNWSRSQPNIVSPLGSLISALKKNWRPMSNSSDRNDYAPQPTQLRIPDMPESLVNYLKGSRAKEIKEAFWSQVEKQWIVQYLTGTYLPWYKAIATYPEFSD